MKKLIIKMIDFYQSQSSQTNPTCRYRPTCSQYTKEAFQKRNFFYAALLSTWRILRCNPLSKGGYDPVPTKKTRSDSMNYLNIELPANDGKTYSLNDFKGQKVILYFYPKDDTKGCTVEAMDFTALKDQFEAKGYKIIGVSKDSVKSHQNFCNKHNIHLLLLSDPEQALIKAFDVLGEKTMYGKTYMGIVRSTFILDEQGSIIKEMRNVKSTNHAQNVLDSI